MSDNERDFAKEGVEHSARQKKADDKIRCREGHPFKGGDVQGQADNQQLMNEMRGNKAALDFNRAMFDYDEEHKDDRKPTGQSKGGKS